MTKPSPQSPFSEFEPYRAPAPFAWSPHAHLWAAEWVKARTAPDVPARTVRWTTPEGSVVRARIADPPGPPRGVLVLFHGLAGHADAPNLRLATAAGLGRGWRCVAAEFRGAGGDDPVDRLYTAADVDAFDAASSAPEVRNVDGPRVFAGLSLGGGMLLRWLGLRGAEAPIDAAAAICPAAHLPSCATALARLSNAYYDLRFAWRMGRRAELVAPRSGRRPFARVVHRSVRRYDADFAAPAAGCSDVDAYYAMASAHHVADRIARPTLILAALDDPLAPAAPVREVYGAHARVDLRMTTHGSHLAFLERRNGTWRSGFAERLLDGLEGLRAT